MPLTFLSSLSGFFSSTGYPISGGVKSNFKETFVVCVVVAAGVSALQTNRIRSDKVTMTTTAATVTTTTATTAAPSASMGFL